MYWIKTLNEAKTTVFLQLSTLALPDGYIHTDKLTTFNFGLQQ